MTTTALPPLDDLSAAIPLGDIEGELNRQLKALQGPGDAPALRARMSNLVIYCHSRELAAGVASELPSITAVHPARVLLLIGEPGAKGKDVRAFLSVRPHRAGTHQQACIEQVTLHAGGTAIERLPYVVRSLLIGDLPTNLWWATPQPPPLAGALLFELSEHAQQIIYDSIGWPDPARGVIATSEWLAQIDRACRQGNVWRVASDLNWRRLKYWRRLLTQALDPAAAPGAATTVTEVQVEHGPHAVIQAWELVSWMAQRLGWQVLTGRVQPGVEIAWRFLASHGDLRVRIRRLDQGPPEVRRLRIACTLNGQQVTFNLVPESDRRLAILLEGVDAAPRTMTVPPLSAVDLVGRQLSDRERDPVFYESMAVAESLARSVLRG